MPDLPCAALIVAAHDGYLANAEWPPPAGPAPLPELWRRTCANHRCNVLLWQEEDKARRRDVDDALIAAGKRRIDRYNQERNDAVEAIDELLLSLLPAQPAQNARLSSETAGAMVDRLSILALKIHHMRAQTQRRDVAPAHRLACDGKLRRLLVQRGDLAACFDRLLREAQQGCAYYKLYRQFKMYNDPALNPYLGGR